MFRRRKRLTDPFYRDIKWDQIPTYQKYLNALFCVIDIDNYTLWSMGKEHDRIRIERDDAVMQKVCCDEAPRHGISPACLQVMLHQYFAADPWIRERHKDTWAEMVVHKNSRVDFFPAAANVRKMLELMN